MTTRALSSRRARLEGDFFVAETLFLPTRPRIAEQAECTDDNTYTIVENSALDHPDVGGREIAAYALLARRCHMPKMTCSVSIAKLAERSKWKRETISDALDKLIKAGLVKRGDRRAGGAYTLPHRHRTKKKDKAKAAAA